MLTHITIPQSRYLNQSTTQRYLSFCAQQGTEPQTLTVAREDGKGTVTAHWIGNPDAEKVLLFLHGGGYTQPATEGYYQYFTRLVKDLNASKNTKKVAVLVLAYTLSPEATYPTQLQEAATVVSYLVNSTSRSPADVFLSGDSAGGGLTMSLLSHILHPHPDVPRIELSEPLGGALLYSPWVSFRTDYQSFATNSHKDMLPPIMLRRWAAMYLGRTNSSNPEADPGSVSGDSYSEPSTEPAFWWEGLHEVVEDMFIWIGGNEVFVDAVRDFKDVLCHGWKKGGGKTQRVTYVEAPREAHIQPFMDAMTNGGMKSDSQTIIEEWYMARLEK
jgi:acetyl esterase/lipase